MLGEETLPIPMKYIDVSRTRHTSLDVMLEKQIEEKWSVDGEGTVRPMDRVHKTCSTEGEATGRIYMVWEETRKEMKNFSS